MDDDSLAPLFAALPEEFVGARDRMAAELARAGKKDESRELKKLRRPSPTAWATNQTVRRARAAVDGFLAASDQLRARQDALLAGKGDQTAYQSGVEGLRQATAAVTAAAREALEGAGRGADRGLVDGVLANLRVAALSAERRRELLEGRLSADLPPADDGLAALGLSAGMPVAPARPALRLVPTAPAEKQTRDDQKRENERREADEKARALAQAREAETDARAVAARADIAARDATARREQARARLDEAEQAVTDAREALRQAEAAQRETAREQAAADGTARAATRRRETLERG